jgi:hypothetical protein
MGVDELAERSSSAPDSKVSAVLLCEVSLVNKTRNNVAILDTVDVVRAQVNQPPVVDEFRHTTFLLGISYQSTNPYYVIVIS